MKAANFNHHGRSQRKVHEPVQTLSHAKNLNSVYVTEQYLWRQLWHRDSAIALIQFTKKPKKQQHTKRITFHQRQIHLFHINSIINIWIVKRNKLSFSTGHVLPQSTVSHRYDSSSGGNSTCWYKSETKSYLE